MAKQFKKAPKKIQKVVKRIVAVKAKSASGQHGAAKIALPAGEFIATIGRRKTATARVRLYKTSGDYVVNDKPMAQYFSSLIGPEVRFLEPFRVTDTLGKYAVSVKTDGSGLAAQLDAAVLGIARALTKIDEGFRPMLRKAGLMSRDPRMKETRKPNTGGKARRKRQSPKR